MIITTTENIKGYDTEVLWIVSGNTVRARHIGRDILAILKSIIGGELKEYSELLADARAEALKRMVDEAQKLKADAVVNVRFSTAQTEAGTAEMLAYGTAVRLN